MAQHVLPLRAQQLISEYSKPLTNPDWRQGSSCNFEFKNDILLTNIHQRFFADYLSLSAKEKEEYKFIHCNRSFTQDLQQFGNKIFEILDYELPYNNFYFLLRRYGVLKNTNTLSVRHLYNYKNNKIIITTEVEFE